MSDRFYPHILSHTRSSKNSTTITKATHHTHHQRPYNRVIPKALSINMRLDYRVCMKDNTFVNHPPKVTVPTDNRPLVAPIYQSVKFSFGDSKETLRNL